MENKDVLQQRMEFLYEILMDPARYAYIRRGFTIANEHIRTAEIKPTALQLLFKRGFSKVHYKYKKEMEAITIMTAKVNEGILGMSEESLRVSHYQNQSVWDTNYLILIVIDLEIAQHSHSHSSSSLNHQN